MEKGTSVKRVIFFSPPYGGRGKGRLRSAAAAACHASPPSRDPPRAAAAANGRIVCVQRRRGGNDRGRVHVYKSDLGAVDFGANKIFIFLPYASLSHAINIHFPTTIYVGEESSSA